MNVITVRSNALFQKTLFLALFVVHMSLPNIQMLVLGCVGKREDKKIVVGEGGVSGAG